MMVLLYNKTLQKTFCEKVVLLDTLRGCSFEEVVARRMVLTCASDEVVIESLDITKEEVYALEELNEKAICKARKLIKRVFENYKKYEYADKYGSRKNDYDYEDVAIEYLMTIFDLPREVIENEISIQNLK